MFTGIRRLYIPVRKAAAIDRPVSSWIVNFELEDRREDVARLYCPGSHVIHVFHTEVVRQGKLPVRNITHIIHHPPEGSEAVVVDLAAAKAKWEGMMPFLNS